MHGAVGRALAALFAIRGKRVFHPRGFSYTATVTGSDSHLLPGALRGESWDAIVRLSKGACLPDPIPDVLGRAIKIPSVGGGKSEDQDLLLASSLAPHILRNMLIASFSFFRCIYSSVLPYRIGDRQVMIGAKADARLRGRPGILGALDREVRTNHVRFDLLGASVTGGWGRIGSVVLLERCSDEVASALRFNPWNTTSELEPAGPLNSLRRSSYLASRSSRPP